MEVKKFFNNSVVKQPATSPELSQAQPLSAAPSENALRLRILDEFESTGIAWIWATDADGRLIYASDNPTDSLPIDPATLLGEKFEECFKLDDSGIAGFSARSLTFQFKAHTKIRDLIIRPAGARGAAQGQNIWISISASPAYDAQNNFIGYRGTAKDVSRAHQQKLIEANQVDYDPLTGLANGQKLELLLDQMFATFKSANRTCAMMRIELKNFKQINDSMGEQSGNMILIEGAKRMQRLVNHCGEAARQGEDEFIIALPDMNDRAKLEKMGEKILHLLTQPYQINGQAANIDAAIGIALFPGDGGNRTAMMHNSGLALYEAKKSQLSQFQFYSSNLKSHEQEREELLIDLREALSEDQLSLCFQPIVQSDDNKVVCLEALMRWTHPRRGAVSPDQFIPIAEEHDLINPLGEWAMRKSCEAALQWPEAIRVAVNISARQFSNPGFCAVVTNVLASTGITPDRLELELPESIFLGDHDRTQRSFEQLKQLGVRLSLDDFGTGYSSLRFLRSAPIDRIKVDRSFVDSLSLGDNNGEKIIAAIISLSDALGIDTTIEGIEAFDQLEIVKTMGAKTLQGWIYSKAISSGEIGEKIRDGAIILEPNGPAKFRPKRRSILRRVKVIHENQSYDAVMREISTTGTGLDGELSIALGQKLIVDMGNGQLAMGTSVEKEGGLFTVEFDEPLVDDGAGQLCTRRRVSPDILPRESNVQPQQKFG